MKNVFIILFLFSTLSTFGQDNSKFKLGGMIVPSYSGNFILKDENVSPVVANTFKGIEAVTLGYSAYLFIRYKAFAKFDINVGLGYSRTNLNTIKNKLIFEQPEPGFPEYNRFTSVYHDVFIPLDFRYMIFQQKKQSFYFTGGLAPALNVSRQKKQTIWYENGNKSTTVVKDDAPYRLLNVRSAWGIGFEGGLTKRMHYFIQPTFNINLWPTFKSVSLNRRWYSFGLAIGMVF